MINYDICDFCNNKIDINSSELSQCQKKCKCGRSHLYINGPTIRKYLSFALSPRYFIFLENDIINVIDRESVPSKYQPLIQLDGKQFSLKYIIENLYKFTNFV